MFIKVAEFGALPRKAKQVKLVFISGYLITLAVLTGNLSISEAREVRSLLEMRHEKVIIQKWDISCGAAALATLLNYQHGDRVSEKEVAQSLMKRDSYIKHPGLVTLRQGFSILDLKRYVNSRGYRGIGYGNLDFKEIINHAPAIVPIRIHGYNHFVIFRGVRGNRVLLSDPAWGNRTVTVDRFKDSWIDYPQLGHVGFVVLSRDGLNPPNQLSPREEDFVMLR